MELGRAFELEEQLEQLFTELNEADEVLKQLKAEARSEEERLKSKIETGRGSQSDKKKLKEARRDIEKAEELIDQLIGETADMHKETKDVRGVAD